ncbi:gamma-glutamylcyclotransferase [Tepidicella baoligensis]|uniref:gamma-glutamylcyclotransferase n=1 Tax=Tepidicella baoligensis TaxID=2707016 RepID=UPI0031B59D38
MSETAHPHSAAEASMRCSQAMLRQAMGQWQAMGHPDLWLFAYGSLIWKTEFPVIERRLATVHGYHRALKMWSRVNRGTPQRPGLVFALLPGGSCQGIALRVPAADVPQMLPRLWEREMPNPVYDPRWLRCRTPQGPVTALAFTLSRRSPNFTGELPAQELQHIFRHAQGRYGTTLDYARQTLEQLRALGIRDRALERLLHHGRGL